MTPEEEVVSTPVSEEAEVAAEEVVAEDVAAEEAEVVEATEEVEEAAE